VISWKGKQMYNDGIVKFSGAIEFDFHDNIIEYEDYNIICAEPFINDVEIDYDVLDQFKESELYKTMQGNGHYYLYFQGEVEYWHDDGYECGTEYDCRANLEYFNITRLDAEEEIHEI
jgi:hypothetical protein